MKRAVILATVAVAVLVGCGHDQTQERSPREQAATRMIGCGIKYNWIDHPESHDDYDTCVQPYLWINESDRDTPACHGADQSRSLESDEPLCMAARETS